MAGQTRYLELSGSQYKKIINLNTKLTMGNHPTLSQEVMADNYQDKENESVESHDHLKRIFDLLP